MMLEVSVANGLLDRQKFLQKYFTKAALERYARAKPQRAAQPRPACVVARSAKLARALRAFAKRARERPRPGAWLRAMASKISTLLFLLD